MLDCDIVAGADALTPIALAAGLAANNFPPSPDDVLTTIRNWAPALAWVVVILVATLLVSRLGTARLRRALVAGGFQLNASILLIRVLWLSVWAAGLLLILDALGVGLTPLTALVAVGGLALSLAVQSVLQNLVDGIYLLAERPFKIGDQIAMVGPGGASLEGRVEDIQLRTTHLRSRENELILVPNSVVFSGVVTNRSAVGGVVRHLTATFPRDADLTEIRPRVLALLAGVGSILPSPAPRLHLDKADAQTWTASLAIWTRHDDATSDAVWALSRAFPEASFDDREII